MSLMSLGFLFARAAVGGAHGGAHWVQGLLLYVLLVIAGVAATCVRRAVRGSDGSAECVG